MKTILFLCLILSFSVQATCRYYGEEINLKKTQEHILKHIPVPDQGNYGYCYAHAATFLVDYMRLKRMDKNPLTFFNTAPVWSAIMGTLEEKDIHEEGGYVCPAVRGVSNAGETCTRRLKESQYYELGMKYYMIAINGFVSKYKMPNSMSYADVPILTLRPEDLSKATSLVGAKKKAYDDFKGLYDSTVALLKARGFSAEVIPTKRELYNELYARMAADPNDIYAVVGGFMKLVAQKECKNSYSDLNVISCEDMASSNTTAMIDEVDDQLEKNMPVGISYCSKFLQTKNYKGHEAFHPKYQYWSGKKDCGHHASVIIGRKMDQYGKCVYLIRNSWGDSADYVWPKEKDGDVWVEENSLKSNINQLHIIH